MILTSVWPSVISLDGHIEAKRPHQRIPCSKGKEGCVGSSGLGVRGEGGSAVGAGRRREPQAMWAGGGKSSGSVEMIEFLSCWMIRERPKLLTWLKGARPRLGGSVIFLLLLVAAKSWWNRSASGDILTIHFKEYSHTHAQLHSRPNILSTLQLAHEHIGPYTDT